MNIGLRQRLGLGMGVLFALTASACVIGLVVMARTSGATDRMLDVTIAEARLGESAERAVLQARRGEKDFLLRRDPAYLDRVRGSVGTLRGDLAAIAGLTTSAERRGLAEEGLGLAETYLESIEALGEAYVERGLSHEAGREGALRAAVHALETDLEGVERDDLRVLMLMARRHEKDFLLRGDRTYLERVEARLAEFELASADVDAPTRERWGGLWRDYADALAALVEAESVIAERGEAARGASRAIEEKVTEIYTGAAAEVEPAQAALASMRSGARAMLVGVLVVSLVVAALVAWVTVRSIVRSIRPVLARADEIASGDLTGEALEVRTTDELGRLSLAVNRMSGSLTELVTRINETAVDVRSMSSDVASGSQETAAQAQEQEAQAGQVSAAVTEMSASFEEVAGQSSSAAQAATEAGSIADEGAGVVRETVETIRGLADRIRSLDGVMERLGSTSEKIGSIVEVINEIAEQTNLLALNAAIEAARAGEHGRGFAVVADEVRKLAERTTEATEEVSDSIRGIQDDTRSAVDEMRDSRERIDSGVTLTERAGSALGRITERSGEVARMVQSIAAATEQQAAAAEEISRSVDAIRVSNEQSAAGSAQAASASTMLDDRAAELQRLVGSFRVR
jgi:methyl-accepting chemotaxis protein